MPALTDVVTVSCNLHFRRADSARTHGQRMHDRLVDHPGVRQVALASDHIEGKSAQIDVVVERRWAWTIHGLLSDWTRTAPGRDPLGGAVLQMRGYTPQLPY